MARTPSTLGPPSIRPKTGPKRRTINCATSSETTDSQVQYDYRADVREAVRRRVRDDRRSQTPGSQPHICEEHASRGREGDGADHDTDRGRSALSICIVHSRREMPTPEQDSA